MLADFRPQWHHIFPKKYLEGKVESSLVDALANIAVIGDEINIRISARDPMNYVRKYGITEAKLAQQFIEADVTAVSDVGYEDWLRGRAARLAEEGNRFLTSIQDGLG